MKHLATTLLLVTILLTACRQSADLPPHEPVKADCSRSFPVFPGTELRAEERPGFSVTATAISSSSIKLTWKAKGQQSYRIEKLQADGSWLFLTNCICREYIDGGLQAGTRYTYRVNGVIASAMTLQGNQPPSSTSSVIYLAHDGWLIKNSSWNYQGPFWVRGSGHTQFERDSIQRVYEGEFAKYSVPVIVTQDSNIYNATPSNRRMIEVFTEDHEWYGTQAGGVAFIGTFGDEQPCFVFTRLLGYRIHNSIFAGVHECGHVLGLWHWGCNEPSGYSMGPNWMGGNYNYQVWERFFGTGQDNRCTSVNQPQTMQNTVQ